MHFVFLSLKIIPGYSNIKTTVFIQNPILGKKKDFCQKMFIIGKMFLGKESVASTSSKVLQYSFLSQKGATFGSFTGS